MKKVRPALLVTGIRTLNTKAIALSLYPFSLWDLGLNMKVMEMIKMMDDFLNPNLSPFTVHAHSFIHSSIRLWFSFNLGVLPRPPHLHLNLFPSPSCRHLDLSNNSLTTLPRETVATAPLLETLVLQANPWSCDCRMSWFLAWSLSHPGDCHVRNIICFHLLFCLPCAHVFYGGHLLCAWAF